MEWAPHTTVAAIIERENRFLIVEKRTRQSDALVLNQPAGHLEDGESLTEAAHRETLEETGWRIQLRGVIGLSLYRVPTRGNTYFRTTFLANALDRVTGAKIDPDIHAVHWLSYEEIRYHSDKLRSPVVLEVLERHQEGEIMSSTGKGSRSYPQATMDVAAYASCRGGAAESKGGSALRKELDMADRTVQLKLSYYFNRIVVLSESNSDGSCSGM